MGRFNQHDLSTADGDRTYQSAGLRIERRNQSVVGVIDPVDVNDSDRKLRIGRSYRLEVADRVRRRRYQAIAKQNRRRKGRHGRRLRAEPRARGEIYSGFEQLDL